MTGYSIADILGGIAAVGTKADPTDAPGCTLEYGVNGWVGFVGVIPSDTFNALPTQNLGNGTTVNVWDTGSTYDVYSWNGTSWLDASPSAVSYTIGTLQEILAATNIIAGSRALPNDVAGTYLEMGADGLWTGASVGTLTQVQAGALVASGALASVKVGTPATIGGSAVMWGGGAWTNPNSPYVDSAIPSSGSYIGQLIQVNNAAVPSGRSLLRWSGTIWAPPAGELIAGTWRTGTSPVALVTPGVTTKTLIWQSAPIPDYMLPDYIVMELKGGLTVKNPAGVAGCVLWISVTSNLSTTEGLGGSWTPKASFTGIGNAGNYPQPNSIHACDITKSTATSTFACPVNSGTFPGNSCGIISTGANRLVAVATPSSATDQIQFDGALLFSKGIF